MSNEVHKPKNSMIIFFISFFLLSVSIVSSIGVIQNKRFYSDSYIYNSYIRSVLSEYCADVYRFVTGAMTSKEEAELFMSQNNGIFYYITNDNTKETFSNIPHGKNYVDFSSQSNIVSMEYMNSQTNILFESDKLKVATNREQTSSGAKNTGFSGYVFIDKNVRGPVSGPIHLMIECGFNLRKILFLESGILGISLLAGVVLLLLSFKTAVRDITGKMDFIPVDAKLIVLLTSLALWIFLFGTYLYTLDLFPSIIRRIILYNVLILLTFIILSFFTMLVLKARQYAADTFKFSQEWESRFTRNIPSWIIELSVQVIGYFFILTAFSAGSTVYDYLSLIRDKWPVIIVQNVLIFLVLVLVSQVKRYKATYGNEVLNKAQQIANGDLSISVPVIGNDFYAKMAAYINILKTSYIHALNEQKKSERLKYELVTNISHDLRTPLTSILNYIGLVKKKSPKGDTDKYADHVETNAKRLNILIEDLFELSKIESGNMQLDISNVDLVLMVKQISHEYGEKMSQNGLELILESKSKQIIRQCDGQKMWRVFDNLINNAVKYSLPGTRIYVSIEELSEQLLISVKNIASYRIDFEPEELFLRFKRGDRARSSDGSGLGLAIAKSIVELHNGSIAIETEGDMFKVIMKFCSDSYVSCIV